jgi:hypothetical protein
MGPSGLFTIPVLRCVKTYGLTHEQLAMVLVVQREWAGEEPARHLQVLDVAAMGSVRLLLNK